MDIFLEKFSGKINTQSLLRTVDELQTEFIDDGITKEDLPPIITRLMMETMIDKGDKDSEIESILKSMVPPIIDGFASMLKLRKKVPKWLRCLIPKH